MRCQNCGSENPDRHIYCDRCGAVIVKPFRIDETVVREPKQALMRAINKRNESDYVMPVVLVFLPLVVGVVSTIVSIAFQLTRALSPYASSVATSWQLTPGLGIVFFGSLLSDLIFAYVCYKFVKRANDHYARERELRTAMISLVRAATMTIDRQRVVEGDLMMMGLMNELVERYRRPWFWAFAAAMPMLILPIIGATFLLVNVQEDPFLLFGILLLTTFGIGFTSLILELMMFSFLGSTMFDHDRRWNGFSTAARTALSKLGFPSGKPFGISRLPERSFGIYLLLSFVTAGIFFYYWLYTLAKDPNEHFRNQWTFEDNVLSSLGVVNWPGVRTTL
ncbi:MAG: DUF4234 domain-containing protein [Thermoplasmata archaeon]